MLAVCANKKEVQRNVCGETGTESKAPEMKNTLDRKTNQSNRDGNVLIGLLCTHFPTVGKDLEETDFGNRLPFGFF